MKILRTTDHAPGKRYDFWHDIVETSFAQCEGIAADRRTFRAEIEIAECGESELTALSSDPVRYIRTARHVRRQDTDAFFISAMLEGGGQFRQNDRTVKHDAGSVLIYDSARPYAYDYPAAYRDVLLRVPRPMMESRMLGLRDLGGTLLTADRPQAALIRNLVTNLLETAREGELPDNYLSPTLDLVASAFGQTFGSTGAEAAGHNEKLNRIKRFMIDNLSSESMSVADICDTQSISARSLGRLFATEGTTPMNWLRERRLAEAHRLLSDGRGRTVTDVALDCGFNDLSYFGRAFRKTYGKTPRQILMLHRR